MAGPDVPLGDSRDGFQRGTAKRKAAGLPERTRFHDLRHTHATLLLSAGTHPKLAQQRLGHAQINVTLDVYSHVIPSLQQAAADKLGALLAVDDAGTETSDAGITGTESRNANGPACQRLVRNSRHTMT